MDGRVTRTGSWTAGDFETAGGRPFRANAAGALTFAPGGLAKTANIYWRDNAPGYNFNYQVDGGAAIQLNGAGTFGIIKTTIDLGSVIAHTLVMNWVAGLIDIIGFEMYDNSPGMPLRIWNMGINGSLTSTHLDASGGAAGRPAFYKFADADLAIIALGVNDFGNSVPLATYEANIIKLIINQRAAKAGTGKVLLQTPIFPQGEDLNVTEQYRNTIRSVGEKMGVPVVDIAAIFQSWSYANSQGWLSDNVHPNAAGKQVIADLTYQAIKIAA